MRLDDLVRHDQEYVSVLGQRIDKANRVFTEVVGDEGGAEASSRFHSGSVLRKYVWGPTELFQTWSIGRNTEKRQPAAAFQTAASHFVLRPLI